MRHHAFLFKMCPFILREECVACMCVCAPTVYSEEGAGAPGAGVSASCHVPCVCWELNPGPLQEQVLSTKSALN